MKLKLLVSIALLTIFTSTLVFATYPNRHMHYNQQKEADSQKNTDSAILGWLLVVNQNEIAAANEALKRNLNPKIKRYAHFLKREHTENLKATLKVSREINVAPVKNANALNLQEKGKMQLSKLRNLDNTEFQDAYINAMVKGHTQVLKALQKDITMVNNPILKRHLIKTEKHVKIHLEKADKIDEQLESHSS